MSSLMVHSDRSFREEMARKTQDPKGSFLLPEGGRMTDTKRPRICSPEWHRERPATTAIFNADYTPGGRRYAHYDDPWTVIGPEFYGCFATHTEALNAATKENP